MDLSDWVQALEQARNVVAEMGLDEVLALPPSQLVAGLRAWRSRHL